MSLLYLYSTAHAKEALDLAKMQEQTEQIKHQEEIRVSHAHMLVVSFSHVSVNFITWVSLYMATLWWKLDHPPRSIVQIT